MHLHGGFGKADIARNLLAKAAVRDLNHDLALPGPQRLEAFPEGGQSFLILPPSAITREAELNGVEELLITKRLRKELNGATLHRLHRHRDVAVSGDEDDWEFLARGGELALKIKTALTGQSHVENQAGGAIRRIGFEKGGNGSKQVSIQAERSQQTPNRCTKVRIVINDQDGGVCIGHRSYARLKDQGNEPSSRFASSNVAVWLSSLVPI